jgi:glycogen synthase
MADQTSPKLFGLVALMRRRPLLTSAFLIAATLTLVFAVKAAIFYAYWTEHRQREIERWMSPNYISRVWMLEVEDIQEKLGIEDEELNRRPIARIARQKGVNISDYINAIEELITDEHGEPPA